MLRMPRSTRLSVLLVLLMAAPAGAGQLPMNPADMPTFRPAKTSRASKSS